MSDELKFHVTMPPGPVPVGTRIIVSLELENASTEALYVNTRFAVVPQIGDVWLTVRSGEREIPFAFRVRLVPVRHSDFLQLKPGEHVVAGYELTRGYRLDKPGTYEITAQYVSQEIPAPLAKLKVFKGQVQAPPAQLVLR